MNMTVARIYVMVSSRFLYDRGVDGAPRHGAETLPQALGRLRVAMEDAYLRASREMGLTAQQAELLCAAMRPASVGELAHTLRCDRSNVTRLVDRASARGLFKRRAGDEDGRVTVVELTPEGERLARRFLQVLASQTDGLQAGWSKERQRATVELLDEISDALEASRKVPPRRRRTAQSSSTVEPRPGVRSG